MTKAYYGGQIKKEHRGDLGCVITTDRDRTCYVCFDYAPGSDEFNHLTGARSVQYPTQRVYMGISSDIADEIAKQVNSKPFKEDTLTGIDKLVIQSYFLE